MQLLNHKFVSEKSLLDFIENNSVQNNASTFIQIFASNRTKEQMLDIKSFIISVLPNASFIGTSTSGIVNDGKIDDDAVILSFSLFENTRVKDIGFCCKSTDEIMESLKTEHIHEKTKLLVAFASTLKFDSSELLKSIANKFPNLVIAGGNAGDDFKFESCQVFSKEHDDSDIVFACLESDDLEVTTDYLFNWETIGRSMVVTKSNGSKVYEIDGKNVIDLYEYYLGKYVGDNLLTYGIEFPLVYERNGVHIARAMIAVDTDERAVIYAGEIPEGTEVKFGYANIEYIEEENQEQLIRKHKYQNEALYVYTCSARRQMLGNFLEQETTTLGQIAPTAGFITYGEFYHHALTCKNNFLNITTTYVCLNEAKHIQKEVQRKEHKPVLTHTDIRFKALTTLLKQTSKELDENLYYLQQFRDTVDSAAIMSITDEKGKITHANKNFQDISGYSEEELLGHSHNIVRNEEMKSETFKDMWKTISSGKIWNGLVKNTKKDGSSYYVLSEIAPIHKKDGSFKEYIGIRTDVTELEEYKSILQSRLSASRSSLQENINYIRQFEEAINLTTAVIKTDTENIIKFVNDKFISLSGYTKEELIGKNCKELRDEKHKIEGTCERVLKELQAQHFVFETMTNRKKNGEIFITNTLFYPIKDRNSNIIEYVQVMFDVTDIYKLNEEIVDTQKEVVEKMGAIGETRSQETGEHVKRVAEYSYLLAKLYGLSEEEATLLKQASPMHDIGKVGIPDSILNKPGKLTTDEFEIMKTHANIGYEMLKHSNRDILKASATVAYTHHEKWDGSGYPNALSGENIPIYGRITAIADVFDALGHDRVYKKAWDMEQILELFNEQRGKHFEPKLIDIFFENLEQFLEIKNSYRD